MRNIGFIIPIEKIAGKINIRVMGVVDEKEVAQIESIYDISPSVVSIAGSCGVLESDRDWSQYGSNFISDIDLRDEMYQFLSNHPSVKDPEAEYFSSGKSMCNEVEEILTDINRSFRDIKSFLDFASGYGRFTRFLIQKMDRERVFVSDIDKNAVDFCIKTFGVKGFYSVDRPHKLLIEDKYDVIFVASLFSHLAIPLWIDWFNRLYEMVDRDGFFIFSTHGDYCLDMLDQESKKRSKEVLEGFIYLEQSETSRLSLKEYGTAYVNYSFIERQCAKSQIDGKIRFYPRGLWNFQDLYVILK